MKYSHIICGLLIFLVAISCQNRPDASGDRSTPLDDEQQTLYDEIMAVHDEVMPRMSELTKLQGTLRTQLDTLRSRQPLAINDLNRVNRLLGGLNKAENAMWNWMHNFGKFDSIPAGEKMTFLRNEKTTVESMHELMVTSLDSANLYVADHVDKN